MIETIIFDLIVTIHPFLAHFDHVLVSSQ